MAKPTPEQLDIIEEIANGKKKFGLFWSICATQAIKDKLGFIKEFKQQFEGSPESMKNNFPEYIINSLKE